MHKKIFTPKRILIIAIAILAVGIIVTIKDLRGPGSGYTYHRATDDTINVAIAYSPMSLYRYGDTLGGLNYEVMKGMAAAYGDKVKFHPVTSESESLDRLERGVYDILMADIPVSASIKERFRVSVPVYTDRMVLVSQDTTLSSTLALAGKQVWVVKGTPAAERIENLSREIGDSIHIHETEEYNAEQLVMLVSAGDIPQAVVNLELAQRLLPEFPNAHICTHISLSQFQSWLFNKDNVTLADTIDAQIERFKLTPAYATLLDRYTGTPGN